MVPLHEPPPRNRLAMRNKKTREDHETEGTRAFETRAQERGIAGYEAERL